MRACVIFWQTSPVGITTEAKNGIFPTQISCQQFGLFPLEVFWRGDWRVCS